MNSKEEKYRSVKKFMTTVVRYVSADTTPDSTAPPLSVRTTSPLMCLTVSSGISTLTSFQWLPIVVLNPNAKMVLQSNQYNHREVIIIELCMSIDGSCSFAGIRFPNFKHIPQELLPCGTRCVCLNGKVDCENRCPTVPDIPPPHMPCPTSMAYRGHLPGMTIQFISFY